MTSIDRLRGWTPIFARRSTRPQQAIEDQIPYLERTVVTPDPDAPTTNARETEARPQHFPPLASNQRRP
jgi:hypothetical protein